LCGVYGVLCVLCLLSIASPDSSSHLTHSHTPPLPCPLISHSFPTVTLFIEDNHGAESTFLHSIKVFGVPVHGTNVAEISSG